MFFYKVMPDRKPLPQADHALRQYDQHPGCGWLGKTAYRVTNHAGFRFLDRSVTGQRANLEAAGCRPVCDTAYSRA